ncbi:hypothetical protein HPB47_000799 [Ixodes persulcatus]|uniref:Uncharacterized protein n=1 Tax=Ixodes persulcatus TaxID=34615 RepID=A0AC60PR38_IXOPE|nr:hypothetical protein HPB47_000799 [Ixodes persulcatus]
MYTTVEKEGPSAKKPPRPVMAFCSVGAGLGPILNSLVHQNQAFLSKPYPLDSQLMEIPLLTLSNESLRIVQLEDLRADITGPWSGLVNANMVIELIRGWSETNRQTLYRFLEVFIQTMVQKVLDRMDLQI